MAVSDDLIDFDLIETHKENIQALPGGRSARQLASVLSPLPSGRASGLPSLDETKTLNDAIRQEYEAELQSSADSDDPLDIYDRYVKWTLNAYPSAQATPQSQLRPLLERATKAFLTSSHYKNDPRYLKLWLHYIRLFSDAPRETFAFLARHNIGEGLGLFYEEFASWLESSGRWNQAEEVYKLGLEREARPAERLMRKYSQFQQRYEARPQNANEPSSPALPTVRPALVAKMDPYAPTPRDEVQVARNPAPPTTSARSGKPKMAIFSDTDNAAPVQNKGPTKGWDDIGSIKDRKKENMIEARSWTGETLKAGKRVGTVPKMEIFKDPTLQNKELDPNSKSKSSSFPVNPRTGRQERVFVNIEAVYPSETEEFSFEELRAMKRGWMSKDWREKPASPMKVITGNSPRHARLSKSIAYTDIENLSESFQQKVDLHETSTQSIVGMPESKPPKQKRIKVREVKQEVQTVKTRLESPTGPKKRRKAAEPTMTFHSKAATNDIYDMFNQPLRTHQNDDTDGGQDTDCGDDTYSTAGESTGTGRISAATSEYGDDTSTSIRTGEEHITSQPESVSPWSDFTASKHIPKPHNKNRHDAKHQRSSSDDLTSNLDSSQNCTHHSSFGGEFDTQAIADLANQDFGEMDTNVIAKLAGDFEEVDEGVDDQSPDKEELRTPIEEASSFTEVHNKPRFVPLPPEDYEPTPIRPYRDPSEFAQHKLPFMTPIVERTESSLAPSTVYDPDNDYFESKTPSRSAPPANVKHDSPSKLQVDALLLDSPQHDSPSPAKRKVVRSKTSEEDALRASPQKKHIGIKQRQKEEDLLLSDFVLVEAPLPTPLEDALFETPSLPEENLPQSFRRSVRKEPAINDLQCNPCDMTVREQILKVVQPPITSYPGYRDHADVEYNMHNSLRLFAKKAAKQKGGGIESSPRKSQSEKTLTKAVPPILKFSGSSQVYAVRRELGQGAFAPVYLVESHNSNEAESPEVIDETESRPASLPSADLPRDNLEALKTESPPHTLVWEFHILRLICQRLGHASRTMNSIITAHECHLYRDEAYLILSYSPQGTLLDLVNLARAESLRHGKPAEGLDEPLAMHLSCELLRTMDALHRIGILHGDLKADNCLVRLDTTTDITDSYHRDGSAGWSSKGLRLIDFGRGIDVRQFQPNAKFVADWPPTAQDCAEIREMRPWKWAIDFHGAAGVVHSLLFGKYIETIPNTLFSSTINDSSNNNSGDDDDDIETVSAEHTVAIGVKKTYKLKDSFKRYWDREIWSDIFAVLLNKASAEDHVREAELTRIISLMEDWLERESEKKDLRGCVRKAERSIVEFMGGGKKR